MDRISNADFNKVFMDICDRAQRGTGSLEKHQYQIDRVKITTFFDNGSISIMNLLSPNIEIIARSDSISIATPPGPNSFGFHVKGNEINMSLKRAKQYKFEYRGVAVQLDFG